MTRARIDPKVVAEARELGLNISKICENALKMAIEQLKQFIQKIRLKIVV
jgi:post-segregation antitoxin (ccd killing protein)